MGIEVGLLLLLGTVIYFLPTLVSLGRKSKSSGGVIVVNVFLGWTLVGWVVALAWAVSSRSASDAPQVSHVLVQQAMTPHASVAEALEKLTVMKEKGLLSDQEYEDAKRKALEPSKPKA